MKSFLEKYGVVILIAIVVIALIVVAVPILGLVNNFGSKTGVEIGTKFIMGKTYTLKTGLAFNNLIPSKTTSIVFTDEVMPAEATLIDVDADGDGGVVAGLDDTTFKVSTQKSGQKVIFNEDSSYMFCGYYNGGNKKTTTEKLESIDFKNVDTSNVTNMSSMFYSAGSMAKAFSIEGLSNGDTSNVTDMSHMFRDTGHINALTWNIGDLSNWDTSNVTDMSYMFSGAGYTAKTFNLNLSGWDTSKVTNMSYMFDCAGWNATLFNLDLSSGDTSKVTDMSGMFYTTGGPEATTGNIEGLSNGDTSNVTDMSDMFHGAGQYATSFNLDLSGGDTSNVTNMQNMFSNAGYYATSWSIGDISDWDTSKVTNMSNMFHYAGRNATYSLNLSGWNVNKIDSHNDFNFDGETKVTAPAGVN